MSIVDLTLNSFIVPRMSSFSNPPFGTVQADPDHPGNTTLENVLNMMLPFGRARPVIITENSVTSEVQADASVILSGGVNSLTLGPGAYRGVEFKLLNDADDEVLLLDGAKTITSKMGESVDLRWNGTEWRVKTDKLVGDFLEQKPAERSPLEKRLEGTWVKWSDRAIMYGISSAAPPAYVDYYTLAGTNIATGATPIVLYHLAGDDYRLFKFKASTAAYAVPGDFDPVKWDYLAPNTIDIRESCQKLTTRVDGTITVTADLQIGAQIAAGSYAGKYITEVIVPGGKFTGIEGGNRPIFVSGGVQPSRIRNISAGIENGFIRQSGQQDVVLTGAFIPIPASYAAATPLVSVGIQGFDASLVVTTGPDVAGTNLSKRLWRRVS
jgi:hypothetical protein